jgi:branched-chain amino acid transport system permease protein
MFSGRARRILTMSLALAILAVVTPFLPEYVCILFIQALIFAILAMGLDVLLGYTGLASLGQAAYFGVGAYTVAILTTRCGFGFFPSLILGVLLAAAVAAIFGLIAIRATGVYFLMLTLALAMVVWGLAHRWNSLTDGDNGISGIPRPELGFDLGNYINLFYFVLVFFVLCLAALYILTNSPFGRSLVGIREGEERMSMLGYNVWLHKYLAFIVAGTFAGIAGVLWAFYKNFVGPDDLSIDVSVEALLMVALGGPATLVGAAVGAGVIVFLRNYVSIYYSGWPYILGGMYIITILYLPGGLIGIARRVWPQERVMRKTLSNENIRERDQTTSKTERKGG